MSRASCAILRRAPTFGAHVEEGKAALKKEHRKQVEMQATCSVNLDTHGPPSERGEKRWDYVLMNHDGKGHGVEVHPARTSDVGDMIAKKRWAEKVLAREARGLAVVAWHWVASGRVDVRRHDRARKQLAQAGVSFPCEHLKVD
jgi:hypothetical protein